MSTSSLDLPKFAQCTRVCGISALPGNLIPEVLHCSVAGGDTVSTGIEIPLELLCDSPALLRRTPNNTSGAYGGRGEWGGHASLCDQPLVPDGLCSIKHLSVSAHTLLSCIPFTYTSTPHGAKQWLYVPSLPQPYIWYIHIYQMHHHKCIS